MQFFVTPSRLRSATLRVPGDKSISHRALLLGAIAEGTTRISGFLQGADCLATLYALESLGVTIDGPDDERVVVHGVGLHGLREAASALDLGNSGTAMRLFAGLLAGQPFGSVLTGDRSLSSRPMQRVIEPLSGMGAHIASRDGRPPLQIEGGCRLHGTRYALPVASAQVKSAMLLAGLYAEGKTVVFEPAVTRDHTERMLAAMGAHIERIEGGVCLSASRKLDALEIDVPADLSSATFPMLAALVSADGSAMLESVGINPTRDGALSILRAMGADFRLLGERRAGEEPVADIEVRSSQLHGIVVDTALVPLAIDEFPALFVAAACAEGATEFRGLSELRVKESDRIRAMTDGLRALGIHVDEHPDGATVHGGVLLGGTVDSLGDHRIAMAFAVAGSVAAGPVRIRDVATVDTSFPGFVDIMQAQGLDVAIAGPEVA